MGDKYNDYHTENEGLEDRPVSKDSPRDRLNSRESLQSDLERRRRVYENRGTRETYYRPKPEKKSGGGFKIVVLALIFSLIGSLVGGGLGYKLATDNISQTSSTTQQTQQNQYSITPNDDITTVSAVAANNLDSVVGVTTRTNLRDMFNRPVASEAMGSGFIVHEDGYILTNDHVVANVTSQSGYSSDRGYADEITIVFNDGDQLPAEVLWSDSTLDLAILKVEPNKPLKVAELGDSEDLIIGEQVIAIGNPLAIEFHGTVTAGYISGLDRKLTGAGGVEMSLIQTDASINQGNSGGPLLNAQGQVIGVNTMKISTAEGLGFSIPINVAKPIIEQIVETGEFQKVTLGFKGSEVEAYEAYFNVELEHEGVIVMEIIENSPMSNSQIQPGDIITLVNGEQIEDMGELQRMLYDFKFGETAEITYIHENEEKTESIELFKYDN